MRSRKAHAEMVTVGCWKYFDRSLNLNGFTDTMGPGNTVMWRGMRRLTDIQLGYELALNRSG